MAKINENYLNLKGSYLFSEIAQRVAHFKNNNPDANIIRLGIGDVTQPLCPAIIEAMHTAVDEMSSQESFAGYGPEQGYRFLIEKIIKYQFEPYGIHLDESEIFVSDGSKCDSANIQEIFDKDLVVSLMSPVYPVYSDTNIMAGRSGKPNNNNQYQNFVYLESTAENGFNPPTPSGKVDLIYLCFPNNPTGTTLTKKQLKVWVDYAKENKSIILFDAAYEAFIQEPDVPHSIYEIEGAENVAIEFRSFSKTAGFTGLRCAYTVVPKSLMGYKSNGEPYSLNALWNRRQCTKFNGASYISQKAAEAVFSDEGRMQIENNISYYMDNAKIIREGLISQGIECYGGINAPYVWIKTPKNMSSWDFFSLMLEQVHVVGTPGVGFGFSGEGYYRLTAFSDRSQTEKVVQRFANLAL
ncbi:LL-diaminopimelate aminotransferase [PVC group bacterium (ex Bugula neritina AB1)]|nr:LL-diaminopimelate aminotransferase [PVC group bacterium (ex Bugula neritina AB1)]